MATDATGTPTPLGIPKFNPSVDAPSGLGFNAAMDAIDALIGNTIQTPAGILTGEFPVWNGSAWERSSQTARNVVSRTILATVGSGTYNLPAGVKAIIVELLGGGGTGGTTQTGSNNTYAASSGGNGGWYAKKFISGPAASYAYTVGAGGAALASGGTESNGNNGGDTTFGASLVVAKGGTGGSGDGQAGHSSPFMNPAPAHQAGSVGDILIPGGYGGPGKLVTAGGWTEGGAGGHGAGPYGGPGAQRVAHGSGANTSGNAATSTYYGAGSSGCIAGPFSGGDVGVGAAAQGLIVITELY